MGQVLAKVGKAIAIAAALPQITLMARAICWEAPIWASADRPLVAAVIRYRMLDRNQTLEEVLYAPYQFSVAHLLESEPEGLEACVAVATQAYFWQVEDLPILADHFWSPVYMAEPPDWAESMQEVEVPGDVVHRFCLEK